MHYAYRPKDKTNQANYLIVLTPAVAARCGWAECTHVLSKHTLTNIQGEQTQNPNITERLPHLVFTQPLLPTFHPHVWGTPCQFPG